jgi:Tuberculosis necrotizing toxin
MGIELPPELSDVAAQAGVQWPEADEEAMARQAQAWREAATGMSTVTTDADTTVRGALDSVRGDTGTAAGKHWQTFVEPDSGHLTSTVRGMNAAADRLEHASQQVGTAKVDIVRNLVALAQNSDAAHSAAAAGHPTALAGLDTAIRGTSANVSNIESNLISAVQPGSGVDMSGVRDPVNANPGTHGPNLLPGTHNLLADTTQGATDLVADTTQGATNLVDNTARGATDLVGNTAHGATNLVDSTARGVTDPGGPGPGGPGGPGGHGPGGQHGPGGNLLSDTVSGATNLVDNTAHRATDLVGNTAHGSTDLVDSTARGATNLVDGTQGAHQPGGPAHPGPGPADVPHGATNLVGNTAHGATNLVGDTAHAVPGAAPQVVGGDPETTGPVPIGDNWSPGLGDRPTPPTGQTSLAGLADAPVAGQAAGLPPGAPAVGNVPAPGVNPGAPGVGGPNFGGGPSFGGAPGGPAPGVVGGPAPVGGAAPGAPGAAAARPAPGAPVAGAAPAPGPARPAAPGENLARPGAGGATGGPGAGTARPAVPGAPGVGAPGSGAPAAPGPGAGSARPGAPGAPAVPVAGGPGAGAARPAESFLPGAGKGGQSGIGAPPGHAPGPLGMPAIPKERDEALALFWVHMFPIGHMPVAADRPARQLPAPPAELDYAPGLRFTPGDHPRSDLVDSAERRAALREGAPPLEPSDALPPEAPQVTELAAGHDPLGGEHERDWDRRYLVRFGSVTAHGISRDGVEFAWPPGEQYPEGGSAEGEAEVLEEGAELDRFGRWEGRVFAAAGTPFAQRSLPPAHLEQGYRRYRVLRQLPVWRAVSAAWFAQPGGGVRYRTTHSAMELVALGYLADITHEEAGD